MTDWLTPPMALILMYSGVLPSLWIVYLLYEDRHKPGVFWFLVLMATAGLWALCYATFTFVQSPTLTLALANFFWALVPTAAVAMFLLAYEYVFKTVAPRRVVLLLFLPVGTLFVLSWFNPSNLVFTPAYGVGADGFLYVPPLGGPVKIAVTKVYGYILTSLAAGMFVGEALRTRGIRRRQTLYLLLILGALAVTTLVKIAGLVPEYFDPTSAAYSISGLLFAYSIQRHGLLKFAPAAREQAFQEVEDIIIVVDPDDIIADVNRSGDEFFEQEIIGKPLEEVLPDRADDTGGIEIPTVEIEGPQGAREFSCQMSSIEYGRGLTGRLVVLSDITVLERRQEELDLLKQILTRIFRHNMRNDLNVIQVYASEIPDAGDDRLVDIADIIGNRASRLQQQAEKAKELEQVFVYQEPVQLSLREQVDRVLSEYTSRPDVVIRSAVDDVSVNVHPRFDIALEELVENAILHHDSLDPPEIDVSSEITDDWVVLRIEDNGPGIPAEETAVIDAREETSLQHSSGVGLWLVKLMVTHLGGEVEIDSGAEGARVTMYLLHGDDTAKSH